MSNQAVVLRCLALCVALVTTGRANAQVEFLEQNWDGSARQTYYTTSQGSRMMPYDWFLALEVSDGEGSFLRDRIPQLGYIPNENTTNNPDQLPVGFVADPDASGKKHIGLTCAACHTNRITFEGKTYQIDGAPTLADMWGMLDGIDQSLNAMRRQPDKFSRFAKKVLGDDSDNQSKVDALREEFAKFQSYWSEFIADSRVKHPWGRARLDAFGMIFNRVTSIDLGIPSNSRKPDAPVSYPFLWGTSFEDRVQWNGSAENSNDVERLGRNVGEVLGVFAQAEFRGPGFLELPVFRTSARRLNQVMLENQLKKLWSPVWPAHLGAIESEKKAAGKLLFKEHCISCHEVVAHGFQHTPVDVVMTPLSLVRTDPTMAENAALGTSSTGDLRSLPGFRSRMPRGELLQKLVRLSLLSPFRDVSMTHGGLLARRDDVFNPTEIARFLKELGFRRSDAMKMLEVYDEKLEVYYDDLREAINMLNAGTAGSAGEASPSTLRYKARPLDGIWATAPYLHNGSVPNLYELLLPVERRTKEFYVGSTEFDPKHVGFATKESPGTTMFDTSDPGNSNSGHDTYGDFNDDERWQLVEYMKSL